MEQEWMRLLPIVISAAQAAGEMIMTYYRSTYDSWDKSPDNPVTTADLAANRLLRQRLLDAAPGAGWLSEETEDNPERLAERRIWVVDPLDGTREFIDGQDEFSVSVAYTEDGQPRLGVIHNPATGETIAGTVEQGVTYNSQPAKPLSGRTEVRGARVLVSDTEVGRGMWDQHRHELALHQIGSSAYKLGLVAAGRGDAYVSLKPKREWDICAGVALILAAGGKATDLTGQPFRFNQADLEVQGVLVANPILHAGLLEMLQKRGGQEK